MSEYIVQSSSLTAVADRLRAATGQTESLEFPDEFIAAIDILTEIPEAPNDSVLFYSPNPFSMKVQSLKHWNGTLYYSTNHTAWNEWNGEPIAAGKNGVLYKIYLRGENCTKLCGNEAGAFRFVGAAIKCIGNFKYLIPEDAILSGYAFEYLFKNAGNIDFDIILPYTTLSASCYLQMFYGCSSMQKAPDLPATSVPSGAYDEMFVDCVSLINPPTIGAESGNVKSFYRMFYGCNSLVNAPALKVSTITGQDCFAQMFYNCVSLETIPALYSLTLGNTCYSAMFSGCPKIKISTTQVDEYQNEYRIPYTGTGTDATNTMQNMFQSTGGTFRSTPTINTTYYTSNTVVTAT